jgi:hypothetical protein
MMTKTMSSTATTQYPTPRVLAQIAAIGAWLGHFPLAIHQLLFRSRDRGRLPPRGPGQGAELGDHGCAVSRRVQVPVLPPEAAAAMASTFEIGCSVLLVIGLASRLATLPMLGMLMTIQLFVYPSAWPEHLSGARSCCFS